MASCLVSFLRVPGGSLSNASSVGAKMVTALAFFRVSTRSKSLTSFTKVLKPGVDAAVSTTSKHREITVVFFADFCAGESTPLLQHLIEVPERAELEARSARRSRVRPKITSKLDDRGQLPPDVPNWQKLTSKATDTISVLRQYR